MFIAHKQPRNDKGEPHGLWEYYCYIGTLKLRGVYIHGVRDGLWYDYYQNTDKLAFYDK